MSKHVKLFENFINDFGFKMAGFIHDEHIVSYSIVYHVTQLSNLNDILTNGLIPNKPSSDEPCAIYLTPDLYGAILMSKALRKKDDIIIFEICSSDIVLYKDPFSVKESGVYTKDIIEPSKITVKTIVDYDIIKNNRNWRFFWDWWFWGIKEKPDFVLKFKLNRYKSSKL